MNHYLYKTTPYIDDAKGTRIDGEAVTDCGDLEFVCKSEAHNLSHNKQNTARKDLIKKFRKAGAETGKETKEGKTIRWFKWSEKSKCDYFASRYNKVRIAVQNMSLRDFSCSNDIPGSILANIFATDDNIVYDENDMPVTMDDFVRGADIGRKYYIGDVLEIA